MSSWLVLGLGLGLAAGCTDPVTAAVPGVQGCVLQACHARVEHIHYGGDALDCVDCHGGVREATTKEEAHPTVTVSFNAATPGTQQAGGRLLAGATLAELDALDPAILRFLNPSDYRVVPQTCGSATRGGGNCHARIVRTSTLSTHATLSGQLAGGLYFGGLTDREARFGVRTIEDPFPVDTRGFVPALERLPSALNDAAGATGGPTERGHFPSMGQLCVECHLSRDGAHVPGKYTSSGCNACHLLTDDSGRPRTADPTQDREEIGHGALHRFTNLIPDSQCNRCHHAHLQRGLLAQGVRERSEPDGDLELGGPNRGVPDSPNVVYWSPDHYVRSSGDRILYGKPYPFYIEDEDGTNDVDETPPDIHTERGMGCIDCHNMAEVHGDDHMAERREFETRVRCESCHGNPDGTIDPETAPFTRALSLPGGSADNPRVITVAADGELQQLGKLDQRQHPVTQIQRRLDPEEERFNPRTLMGCGLHAGSAEFRARLLARFRATDPSAVDEAFPGMPEGSSLADDLGERGGRMECFACHNAWTLNCYGCHVVRDDRQEGFDVVTGERSRGRISTLAMSVVPDALALGFGTRGRITPMVGTSIFFTHIDASGARLVDASPLHTVDGFAGDGSQHNPVHHHTIRRQPRDCQGCHPRADGVADDVEALRRAVGIGTGRYVFVDGEGRRHLLDRLLAIDFDGDGSWDDPETTPLSSRVAAVRPLAASTHLAITPEAATLGPGPLDAVTIGRILGNRVVPQRP